MGSNIVVGCLVAGAVAGVAWSGPDPLPMQFSEVGSAIGINVRYSSPSSFSVPPMFGGMAAGDFNRDGLDDLFVLGGGEQPDQLLIAEMTPDGVRYTDRAAESGIDYAHIGTGVSVADYNNDGYLDLYVTSFGPVTGSRAGRHILYQNAGPDAGGTLSFTDVAEQAGVNFSSEARADGFSSSWGDIDLDGDLDLIVAGWIGDSGGNRLFRNNNNGTFTDITADAIALDLLGVRGFTPRIIDVTGDAYPELLIAADYGTSVTLLNDGTGRFTDYTAQSQTSHETNGMGATNADFNNDGLVDWYVTSIFNTATIQDGNKLYLNQGAGVFAETSVAAGVDDGGWGWGTAAGDLDLDGDVDIVETNGWLGSQWFTEHAYVFLNDGDGATFADRSAESGITFDGQGRGILLWDMDRDGDLDAAFPSTNARVEVFQNDRSQRAPAGWVAIRLDTQASDSIAPDGVGTIVRVTTDDGVTRHRWIQANSDYLSQGPIEAHFGLGNATAITSVVVEWPNGAARTLPGLALNSSHTLASCDADTNGDGVATTDDVSEFIQAFLNNERRADLVPDKRLNFFDVAAYVNAYHAGCPADTSQPGFVHAPPPAETNAARPRRHRP